MWSGSSAYIAMCVCVCVLCVCVCVCVCVSCNIMGKISEIFELVGKFGDPHEENNL